MKAIVLLNGQAGSLQGDAGRTLRERLEKALRENGVEAEIRACDGGAMEKEARDACAQPIGMLLAGGGDGSLNAVVNGMAGTDIALGVLPLGTLNHFAKDLGIPLEIDAAVSVLKAGAVRRVDLGEVNGRLFLNNSSIGLYPRIVRHRDAQRETLGRGKWWAMALSAMHVLRTFPLISVRIQTDGETRVLTTPFVFLGNNDYRMDLLNLGTREGLEGGQLSVSLARCDTRWGLLKLAVRGVLGRLRQERDFLHLLTADLEIAMARPAVDVSVDGEILRMPLPLRYAIRPKALAVYAPSSPDHA
jgi:diacylglycerol kinase family enzyme